jgi:hypothetical protein
MVIIDRDARVVPPRPTSKAISRAMGALIGKADRDSQLRALLWIGQSRIEQRVEDGWRRHVSRLERELKEAEYRNTFRLAHNRADEFQRWEVLKAAAHVARRAGSELEEARDASAECARARSDHQSALDCLAPLDHHLRAARERLDVLLSRDRERLHVLALREEHFRRARASDGSMTSADLAALSPGGLADLVRNLLGSEGWAPLDSVPRQPGVVVMRSARERTIAVSVGRSRRDDVLDAAAVQAARQAAARAGAETAVVVRNAKATQPGLRHARDLGVRLVDREALERWAIWRCPLELSSRQDDGGEGV